MSTKHSIKRGFLFLIFLLIYFYLYLIIFYHHISFFFNFFFTSHKNDTLSSSFIVYDNKDRAKVWFGSKCALDFHVWNITNSFPMEVFFNLNSILFSKGGCVDLRSVRNLQIHTGNTFSSESNAGLVVERLLQMFHVPGLNFDRGRFVLLLYKICHDKWLILSLVKQTSLCRIR